MKKEFDTCPKTINEEEWYGFSWMEMVLAIPSPLVVVKDIFLKCMDTIKNNGFDNDEITMSGLTHYDELKKGRYGEGGYLYNLRSPINPDTGEVQTDDDCVGIIRKMTF